jgi:uncharacterized membrane protein YjjP (DUF1212 family)
LLVLSRQSRSTAADTSAEGRSRRFEKPIAIARIKRNDAVRRSIFSAALPPNRSPATMSSRIAKSPVFHGVRIFRADQTSCSAMPDKVHAREGQRQKKCVGAGWYPIPMTPPLDSTDYAARVDFVVELAGRLHAYGTTAHRLEGAVTAVSAKLGLECGAWSNPTGMILSFGEAGRGRRDTVRVVRLLPGDTNLYKLCEADRIAEAVMSGALQLEDGHAALRALDKVGGSRRALVFMVLAFGLASASVAGLLRLPWLDIATAGITGLLIGLLEVATQSRPRLKEASEALAAMLAAMIAVLVASFIGPLNLNTVIIASLIVLMPGLALTNAVNELTNQNLVSGTARFAGAITTVLKLAIGMIVVLTAAEMVGLRAEVRALRPQPDWVEGLALLLAAYAFAVLFRCHRRDFPLVMLAAASGYLIARGVGDAFGSTIGVFMAALAMTAAGNAYGRWMNRPGALVRLPGIIMLVPGSASLRGLLALIQQQDVQAGQAAALAAANILIALIAGLLLGNLLIPTRRNL